MAALQVLVLAIRVQVPAPQLGCHHGTVRRTLLVSLVATLLVLLGVVLWQRGSDDRAGREALSRAEQAARSGGTVAAAELTDETFSRLVVVPGTAGADDIRRAVGTDWRPADDLAYHCCDPAPIWVFVGDDEVVAFFRASQAMGYGDDIPAGSYRPGARLALGGDG
jgi:hypothetical protein